MQFLVRGRRHGVLRADAAGGAAHGHKLLSGRGVDAHHAVNLRLGDAHLDGNGKALQYNTTSTAVRTVENASSFML